MLSTRKLVSTVMAVFLALVTATASVDAQEAVSLDFAGGVGIPAGDLADFQELGPAFDIGVNIRVHPRISLRASGGAELLSGTEDIPNAFDPRVAEEGLDSDFSTVHFNGGPVFHLLEQGPWRLDANAGAGVTILTSEREEISGVPFEDREGTGTDIIDLNETYFNVTAGLDLGYMVSEQVEFFVGGDGHLFFIDDQSPDVMALSNLSPDLDTPSTGWTFPVGAGVRFHFEP